MKIDISNPMIKATEGIHTGFIRKKIFKHCVMIMTIGTAITASQNLVCIVGKCSMNAPRITSIFIYVAGENYIESVSLD
ncbi:hypothetical protein [Ureibacillus sinduriensis]|uniref:hypothetical protein n=1 Tax=Ureibacillus sinduriensis TaxID=561440 RepID=UPI000A4E5C05|nr:hypothetical protein [Ureibacillus sinduriensis]